MLRLEHETGWWLVTHQDHARLAGAFAERWGNAKFQAPVPRQTVLRGIRMHDDGWAARDCRPQITRDGLPSAFSAELVGKYSAFEEIDLADYIAVRESAVRMVADADAYAGLLVLLHTYNLLTERADRATINPAALPLLDAFLERLRTLEAALRFQIAAVYAREEVTAQRVDDHFRLLQATDNLSLLASVDFGRPASLLHALPLVSGGHQPIAVEPCGPRCFRLEPWPFAADIFSLDFPARSIGQKTFASAAELQALYQGAPIESLTVTVRA